MWDRTSGHGSAIYKGRIRIWANVRRFDISGYGDVELRWLEHNYRRTKKGTENARKKAAELNTPLSRAAQQTAIVLISRMGAL